MTTPELYKVTATTTQFGTEYRSQIKGYQTRNRDGQLAGWRPGTPEGERIVTQIKFVPFDYPDRPITYTNIW